MENKKMNAAFGMDFMDAMNIIIDEYAKQNNGKIKPQLLYAVDKNKKLIYDKFNNDKKFMKSFKDFCEIQTKIDKVKSDNTKIKKTKGKNVPIMNEKIVNEEVKKIEEENKEVIEKYKKNLTKEIELDKDLYKIKIYHLPDLPKKLIDFLIKFDLIIE